jgi:hypothetical protein
VSSRTCACAPSGGTDEFQRLVRRLQGDVLLLAAIPSVQGIDRALEANGPEEVNGSEVTRWKGQLRQIFLSVARVRPEYA